MRPPNEDLEHRQPVWQALSDMYLDCDVSASHNERVEVLAASPYSLEELEQILVDEVHPVCSWNLCKIADEWAGFDPEWLRNEITSR
ncbi:MAG: DUF7079 family protein [Chthoniobacteraceae bacterium]